MVEMRVSATITPGDMAAAIQFMDKRIRRHDGDHLEGMSASLFAVMMATGECLTDCGIPVSEVERMFDQFKAQVVFTLSTPAPVEGA